MPGLMGMFETFLRSFRTLAFAALLSPLIILCAAAMTLAATPSVLFFQFMDELTVNSHYLVRAFGFAFSISFGYVIYGFCIIFVVPAINFLLPLRIRPWKGIWYSLQSIPWFVHNALTYIVRYTFLEFLTPSPLNVLFYKMMGMKVGKGVIINSTNISDPALITLGDYVTVGGSAHIFAHYGQKGILIMAPVIIKDRVTVGLKASIMGDVIVEEGAIVKPHTVLLPKSRVAAGTSV